MKTIEDRTITKRNVLFEITQAQLVELLKRQALDELGLSYYTEGITAELFNKDDKWRIRLTIDSEGYL